MKKSIIRQFTTVLSKMGGQLRLAGLEPHPGRIDPQLVPVISLSLLLKLYQKRKHIECRASCHSCHLPPVTN